MKKALVSVLFLFAFSFSFSQTFSLTDKHFRVYDCYRSYNLYFPLGKAEPRPECFPNLDSVVNFLNINPTIKLEIGFHFDSRASDYLSTDLSGARAKNIRDYIVNKGIDPNRLLAKGYRDKKLLISDAEIAKLKTKDEIEAAHQKNRRVEYKILPCSDKNFYLNDSTFAIGSYYRDYRIRFYNGKSDIMPDSYPLVDSIANFMKTFPFLKFEIGVHTDSRGSAEANVKISQARAKSLNLYLVEKGIDSKRLILTGYGESKLLVEEEKLNQIKIKETYEVEQNKNRRVEFTVLAI